MNVKNQVCQAHRHASSQVSLSYSNYTNGYTTFGSTNVIFSPLLENSALTKQKVPKVIMLRDVQCDMQVQFKSNRMLLNWISFCSYLLLMPQTLLSVASGDIYVSWCMIMTFNRVRPRRGHPKRV